MSIRIANGSHLVRDIRRVSVEVQAHNKAGRVGKVRWTVEEKRVEEETVNHKNYCGIISPI